MLINRLLFPIVIVFLMLFPSSSFAQEEQMEAPSRNDFKFTLLSLGSGSTRITYERAFSPLNSVELTLGFVGLGWDWMNDSDPLGLLVKLAYKWRLVPQKGAASWLAGFYVKPELVFAHFLYSRTKPESAPPDKCPETTIHVALLGELGYQLVLDWFVFDIYSGLGPSIGTGNANNYFHSFMLFPKESLLAFTAGFRIGVAF